MAVIIKTPIPTAPPLVPWDETPEPTPRPAKARPAATTPAPAVVINPEILPPAVDAMDLVKVEPTTVAQVFETPGALRPMLEALAAKVRSTPRDTTTDKGRKAIASLAYSLAKAKTYLDKVGKDHVAELKARPALVDSHRKEYREFLEALQDEFRAPLTAWEAEQARLEVEEAARVAAAALAQEVDNAHEFAILLDAHITRDREEAKARAEQAKKDEAARIAQEAAEAATKSAAAEVEPARLATARATQAQADAEQRTRDAQAKAEQDRKDAEARAERERIAADQRAKDAAEAATRAEQARQEEITRRAEAEAARLKALDDARTQDVEHKRTFNREAWADIQAAILAQPKGSESTPEETATAILTAIIRGQVRHTAITY